LFLVEFSQYKIPISDFMFYLLLSIGCSVSLFITFRYFQRYQVDTFHAIAINYLVCVVTGMLFVGTEAWTTIQPQNWWWLALFLGGTFISTFYLMGLTTQKVGMTIASLASKMSMVIPVGINLLFFAEVAKDFDKLNFLGLLMALVAVGLSSYSPKVQQEEGMVYVSGLARIVLPLSIFALSGVIETSLNYANLHLLQAQEMPVFPIGLFATAAFIGLIGIFIQLSRGKVLTWRSVVGGIVLGVPNYFSIYFLLKSLEAFNNNGAFVFPVNNICIIIVSAFISVLLFKEKLHLFNKIGVLVAIAAILLLGYQKLLA